VLRSSLSDAVQDDILEVNVLRDWEWKVKDRNKEDDVDPFTFLQQKYIFHDPRTDTRWAESRAMWAPWNRRFPKEYVPDPAHLRVNDADSRRTSGLAGNADGA